MSEPAPATTARLSTEPRRMHPLSPLARLWGLVVLIAFVLLRDGGAQDGAQAEVDAVGAPLVVAGGFLLVAAVVAVSYVFWWRTSFWFDDDGDLRVASGIVQTRERRVQLSRLQSVDVVRPLAARVLGLAELRLEVAGGSGSNVKLAYLGHEDAVELRAEMLARSAGVEHDRDTGPVPEAPETTLVTVPTDQLIRSVLLGLPAIIGVLGVVAVVVVVAVTGEVGLLFTLIFVVLAPLTVAYRELVTWFGFVLAESPDGLRTRHGLIETRAQTIPPGRVQAVGLSQPLLWRSRDWVRVHVDVAGYGGEESDAIATVLAPVVPRSVANALLARVLPGFDPTVVPTIPVPERARWRAPVLRRGYAAGLGDTAVVSTSGRLTRRVAVVPYARVQSVRLDQGPVQRRLDLASVYVDTARGPVNQALMHRDATQARAWTEDIAARALAARGADTSERWMRPRPRD